MNFPIEPINILQNAKLIGRDHISTNEFALLARVKPQTLQKRHHDCGHYFGVRPKKLANRLLAWPINEIERFLLGDQHA